MIWKKNQWSEGPFHKKRKTNSFQKRAQPYFTFLHWTTAHCILHIVQWTLQIQIICIMQIYTEFGNVAGLHNCLEYIPSTILSFSKPQGACFQSDLSHWHLLERNTKDHIIKQLNWQRTHLNLRQLLTLYMLTCTKLLT